MGPVKIGTYDLTCVLTPQNKRQDISRQRSKADTYKKTIRFGYQLTYRLLRGERNNATGAWIREQLLDLGPTYVKIGQIVSSRPDLFPDYVVDELEKLQNNVPSFDYSLVKQIFVDEFSCDMNTKFQQFSIQPIASASIGQVHIGKLKNGKRVAVKVQRPTIKDDFTDDLEVITNVLNVLKKLNNKNINDVVLILNECTKSIEQEVDFENEKKNMLIFNKIFWTDDEVVIPRVYSKMTTSRFLVMEYVPGMKINNLERLTMASIDTSSLAKTLMSMFIKVILKYGYLHCDPHAGNLSVTSSGQIILYDYGLVTKFDKNFQDTFKKILYAFFDRNTTEIMELILSNRIIYATESNATSVAELTDNEYVVFFKLVEYIFEYTNTLDINDLTQNITSDQYIDINNIPLVFDSKMILLFKTMTTLEGICKQLDPEFNYNQILLGMVTEVIDTNFLMDRAMNDLNDVMKTTRIRDVIDFLRDNLGRTEEEGENNSPTISATDMFQQAMRQRPRNVEGSRIDKDRMLNARLGKMEKRITTERMVGAMGLGAVILTFVVLS